MAIWYWVLYEKGMVHDDYNYDNWSTLNPKVSNYARLVACRPEDVTIQVRPGRLPRTGPADARSDTRGSRGWMPGGTRRRGQDFENMGVDLFDREKVHINLIIMEARRQAELVYMAHAMARFAGE